jgi:hypothetical protein
MEEREGDSSPLPLLPLLKRIEIMGRICIKGKVFSEASLSRPLVRIALNIYREHLLVYA